MNDFFYMHVFFIVTTGSVVIVTLLLALVLYYIVRILRTVDAFSQLALDEAAQVREDIADLRASVRAEGMKWRSLAKFIRSFVERFVGGKGIKK